MNKLLILLSFITSQLSAQIKLQITSADGKPLAFATVTNISKANTFSADISGVVNMPSFRTDTLLISYVGYKTKQYVVDSKIIDSIVLFPQNFMLPAILIKDCNKFKKSSISNKEEGNSVGGFLGFGFSYGMSAGQYAFLLKSDKPQSFLKEFTFELIKGFAPDSMVHAPLQITFYAIDSTGLPGYPISNPIVYFPKKIGKQTLDLDTLRLHIPFEGIFISFQYIMDEKYSYAPSVVPYEGYKDYGVIIAGVDRDNDSSYYFDHVTGKWYKSKQPTSLEYSATIRYCAD